MKKLAIILLSVLLAVSVLVSCSETPAVDDVNGDVNAGVEQSGTEAGNETEDVETPEEPEEPDEVLEEVIPEKVLKFTVSSSGKISSKTQLFNVDAFNVPAGSTFEYDVYLEDDVHGLGVLELKYSDGTVTSIDNEGSIVDGANILTGVEDCDLTDLAYGKWYRRVIPLNDGGVDSREIDGIRFGVNGLEQNCKYVAYFDNIRIKDSSGNIVKEFTEEEITSINFNNVGGVECVFEIVDDTQPRMERLSAEGCHSVEKVSSGTVAEGTSIDVVLKTEQGGVSAGVYFGGEDSSYIETVDCYVVYNNRSALQLYHVNDKVALASPVSVINMVDDLTLRFKVEGSLLNVYACDSQQGGNEKLIWSVPANIQAGADCGKINVTCFGATVAGNTVSLDEGVETLGAKTYDADAMPIIYLNCSTDKNPLEYAVGENMVFDISAYCNGELISCPLFKWYTEGDDGSKAEGYADASLGLVKVITRSDVPGFEYIGATATNGRKSELKNCVALTAGAGAGVNDMKPTREKPSDFEEFWQGKLDELETIEPVLLEAVQVEDSTFSVYNIKVDAGKYGYVSGKLAYPKTAKPGSLQIKVTFMGYGVGDVGLLKEPGYINLVVSAHSIEVGQPDSYYSALSSKELKKYGFNNEENSDRETVYFLGMLMRDVQAVRYLMTSEYWNGKNIVLEGGSQGGFQSIAVGALMNDCATRITSWAPAFCDWAGMTAGRLPSVFPFPDYQDPLSYYDSVNFATMVKAPVNILTGLGDNVCRPSGIALMYKALNVPKEITWVQNMTHGLQYDFCLTYKYSEK